MERFLKWFSNVILFSCIMAVAAFSPEYIKCSISIRFQDRNRVARGSPRSFINNLFSTRPIDEPDRDAHVPRHATLSFEPIIEPKSVITGESHPKLVPAPSSRPFLPCTTEQKVQQLFPPAAFSRTLFPCDCPSIGTRKRRSPSFRDLVYLASIASNWFSPWREKKRGGCGKWRKQGKRES